MNYDLIVIGSGPGGYPAAAAGVKAGFKTLLIENRDLGGTCLNRGCIPTKTFCRAAEFAAEFAAFAGGAAQAFPTAPAAVDMAQLQLRKEQIVTQLRDNLAFSLQGVEILHGTASFTGPHEIAVTTNPQAEGDSATAAETLRFTAPRIIVATGSKPSVLPIPGSELCLNSDQVLSLQHIPESLAIIGGGVIGMEFADIFNSFGTQVTVIEYCKEILPGCDRDIAKRLRSTLQRRGIKFFTSAAAEAVEATETGRRVLFSSKGKQAVTEAEMVLMAVGRKTVVPDGLAEAGAEITPKGIVTDPDTFATTIPGVYAVGDCNGRTLLAHAATAQATHLLHLLAADASRPSIPDSAVEATTPSSEEASCSPVLLPIDSALSPIPAAVFTRPEIAMTGLTEEAAEAQGLNFIVSKIPVRSNGKALIMDATEGLVKLIVEKPAEGASPLSGRILGCHIMGPHASDLIMEASLAISANLPVEALVRAIHPHPTLSELIHSVAEKIC